MAERSPIFELHIRPLFRLLDQRHMLRVKSDLDLWDYDAVKANAAGILRRVGGTNPSMPTPDAGGAWPSEWVSLFDRWMRGGFRRLSLGTGRDYQLVKAGNNFTLSCKVDIPNADDAVAWLEAVAPGPVGAVCRLAVYPGESSPPPAEMIEISCSERVDAATAGAGVTVIDAAGSHAVRM